MNDFYRELIDEIECLIADECFNEARNKIDRELKMPYVPRDVEEHLIKLRKNILCDSDVKTKLVDMDEAKLLEGLSGDLNDALMMVEFLKNHNIRNYLNAITSYLSHKPNPNVRAMLISLLVNQQVSDEITLDYDGMEVTFVPSYVDLGEDSDGLMECYDILDEWLLSDNPTLCKMCKDVVTLEYQYRLPFDISDDEVLLVCKAALKYVCELNDDIAYFNGLSEEKKLANIGDYVLLLYKY